MNSEKDIFSVTPKEKSWGGKKKIKTITYLGFYGF